MKYMGSKNRIAKDLLQILLQNRQRKQVYIEPFAGGCNLIDKVAGPRIANDAHPYLVPMWEALVSGWKPKYYSRDEYYKIKSSPNEYPAHVVRWVGFNCSYSGKWFGGYAGKVTTKGGIRDYQKEALTNTLKQVPALAGVQFKNVSYDRLKLPHKSIVYCDPPYEGTTGYALQFDSGAFWAWCRRTANAGHTVFVSEYRAPTDFRCVWQRDVKSSLSANGVSGSSKTSTEKLFTL